MKLYELTRDVQRLGIASADEIDTFLLRADLFPGFDNGATCIARFGPDGAEAWLKERLEIIWTRNPNEARAIFHAARALPRGERAHALVYELLVWMANRHDRALLAERPAVHLGSAAG